MLVTEIGKTQVEISKEAGFSDRHVRELNEREDFREEVARIIKETHTLRRARCYRGLDALADAKDIQAIKEGLNRTEGKVAQKIDLEGKVDGDLKLHDGRIVEDMDDGEIQNALFLFIRDLENYAGRRSTCRRNKKKRSKKKS